MQVGRIVRSCEREGGADMRGVVYGTRDVARARRDAWTSRGVLNSDGRVGGFHHGGLAGWRGCLTAMRRGTAPALWRGLSARDIRGDRREGKQRERDPLDGSHAPDCGLHWLRRQFETSSHGLRSN